jgi:hypothetical protein
MDIRRRFPLVEIMWNDATTDNEGWCESSNLKDDAEVACTTGFLVHETQNFVWIASTVDENHSNGRMKIPTTLVISRRIIRKALPKGKA